jgi:hypothetical protein
MSTTDERDPETFALIGVATEVHRNLGHGYLDAAHQEIPAVEFMLRSTPAI